MILLTSTSLVMNTECCANDSYQGNGATNFVPNDRKYLTNFQPFSTTHSLALANDKKIEAIGKVNVKIQAAIGGKWRTLVEQWYVSGIQKNVFPGLAVHDKHPTSQLVSTTEIVDFKVDNTVLLVRIRERFGGVSNLAVRSVKPTCVNEVNLTEKLYLERLGNQNKRHVKALLKWPHRSGNCQSNNARTWYNSTETLGRNDLHNILHPGFTLLHYLITIK